MPERVLLFGSAVIGDRSDGRPLPVDRRGCLLAYLATDGDWVDRDRLALLFWPDTNEVGAKRNLRQLLLRTKRLGLDPELDTRTDSVRWRIDSDVAQFRRALASGDHGRATALYDGPFLEGFAFDDTGAAGAWIETERERLHAAFHGAAMREAAALSARGELQAAHELLADLHRFDEYAEDVVAAYLTVLAQAGRRDAAIEVYERFAAALQDELGLEPLDDTRELLAAIRRGDVLVRAEDEHSGDEAPSLLPAPLRSPRLVGRDAERSRLLSATTPLIVVGGAPGSGKTRLLRETYPQASFSGASEGLEQVPYHPFSRLIRERIELAAGLDSGLDGKVDSRVDTTLGGYVEDLARLVPEVAPDLSPAPLDAGLVRARLAEALARFVELSGQPLVLDDLQWADSATLETIHYLTDRGVKVIGAYRRSEVGNGLGQLLATHTAHGMLTKVTLDDLGEAEVRELLADLMGRTSGPPTFARWLWQRSSGNPMFLLESIKALFESGALWSADGNWHTDVDELTQDYTELDVPPLVSEVILRRVANLSPEAQRVLSSVAVSRVVDDQAFLAKATGLSLAAVADALDEGAQSGFLLPAGDFQHDLLRQAVAVAVDPQRRRLLHGLAGEYYESSDQPELAAEHLWESGHLEGARKAWARHVWQLRTRGLFVDAVAVLRTAVARLPSGEQATWLRLLLIDTLREADQLEEARGLLPGAVLPADSSPELQFRRVQVEVALLLQAGSLAESAALLEEARHLESLIDDAELIIDHTMFKARIARDLQRHDEAVALLAPIVDRLRQERPDVRLVQFMTSLAVLNDDLGLHDRSLELHTEALALAKVLGSRYFQAEAANNMVVCLTDLGRYDQAIELAEHYLDVGDYDNAPLLRINLAATCFAAERFEDALRHYRLLCERSEPHLRLIALGRSAECLALVPGGDSANESAALLDAALDELLSTDYPPSVARVMIAVLEHGSPEQCERLKALRPRLGAVEFPSYLIDELKKAEALARKRPTSSEAPV